MSESILSTDKECYVCGTTINLHRHHIFPGNPGREISEREGCWVWLCGPHHNLSSEGVHFDRQLDNEIRKECQKKWMEVNNATEDDFRKTFKRGSYL